MENTYAEKILFIAKSLTVSSENKNFEEIKELLKSKKLIGIYFKIVRGISSSSGVL